MNLMKKDFCPVWMGKNGKYIKVYSGWFCNLTLITVKWNQVMAIDFIFLYVYYELQGFSLMTRKDKFYLKFQIGFKVNCKNEILLLNFLYRLWIYSRI